MQPRNDRSSSGKSPEELRATLGEHLEELRQRLFRIVGALVVGMVAGWLSFELVHEIMQAHAKTGFPPDLIFKEAFRSIEEAFFFKLKMSFYIALLLTLPFSVYEIWGFISPGLKPKEKRPFRVILPISVVLFFMGATICWMVLPITLGWFAGFPVDMDVEVIQDPGSLVMLMTKMILAFGIGFQMPLIVYFLTKVGIVSAEGLLRYWRHCIFGVFLLSAIITPSGDPAGMLALAVPLTALFFASVFAAKWSNKKALKEDDPLNNLD